MTEVTYREARPHPDDFIFVAQAYKNDDINTEQFRLLLMAWAQGVSFFGLEEALLSMKKRSGDQ